MDKLQAVDWRGFYKSAANTVKKYTKNMSELEIQVEDATSLEVWGPHGSVMNDIAEASYDPESYRQIMAVISRRLKEEGENWRMCYKALLLLEFLIKHGPMRVAQDAQSGMGVLDRLTHFQYKDPNGRDHGQNVRHRASEIKSLITDRETLRAEREKAKANRTKYTGVSGDDMRAGVTSFGGGGYGNRPRGSAGLSTDRPNLVSTVSSWAPSLEPSGGRHSSLASTSFNNQPEDTRLSFSSQRSLQAGESADLGAIGDSSHVIMRRGGSNGAPLQAVNEDEAVAATRARIEALKVSSSSSGDHHHRGVSEAEQQHRRKLLSDTKVNPKIAASLGLKIAQPVPAKPREEEVPLGLTSAVGTNAPGGAEPIAPANQVDLIADLLDKPIATTTSSKDKSASSAAPCFDPFATALESSHPSVADAAAPGEQADSVEENPAWDAFAPALPENGTATRTALPEDMFSSLSSPPSTAAKESEFVAMLGAGGYGAKPGVAGKPLESTASKPDPFADLFK